MLFVVFVDAFVSQPTFPDKLSLPMLDSILKFTHISPSLCLKRSFDCESSLAIKGARIKVVSPFELSNLPLAVIDGPLIDVLWGFFFNTSI